MGEPTDLVGKYVKLQCTLLGRIVEADEEGCWINVNDNTNFEMHFSFDEVDSIKEVRKV